MYRSSRSRTSYLAKRVTRLEKAMGIRPKKNESIESRVKRLEKILSKKKSKKSKKRKPSRRRK